MEFFPPPGKQDGKHSREEEESDKPQGKKTKQQNGLYFKIIAKYVLKIDYHPKKHRNVCIIEYYYGTESSTTAQRTCVCFIQSTGTSNGERGFKGLWYPSLGWDNRKHWIVKTSLFWDKEFVCQADGTDWKPEDYSNYDLPSLPPRAPVSFVSANIVCPTNDLLNYFLYLPHLLISYKLTPEIFINNTIELDVTNVIQLPESALLAHEIPDNIWSAEITCINPHTREQLDFSTHEKFVATVDKANKVRHYDILETYVKPYENYVGGLLNAVLKYHSCLRLKAPITFGQQLWDIVDKCISVIDDFNQYFRPVAPVASVASVASVAPVEQLRFSIGTNNKPKKQSNRPKGGKSVRKTRKRRRTKKRVNS
jgi:hypothetical protein